MSTKNEKAAAENSPKRDQLMDLAKMPDLHKLNESPIDLSSEYWTPETEGDYKVGVILDIQESTYTDEGTGEVIHLPCVVFVSQEKDGSIIKMRNGSKRLVATIENAVENGDVEVGTTPVKLVYLGKKKNSTNSHKSDRWSVKKLIV